MRKLSSRAEELLKKINADNIPEHIAIIMDGNGRWAKKRRLRRIFGHKEGTKAVRESVRTAVRLNNRLKYLTLYAFSIENWKRPQEEIQALMSLLEDWLDRELEEMLEENIRLEVIGRIKDLPQSTRDALQYTMEETSDCNGLILTLALSYGGRQEIVDAINEVIYSSNGNVEEITIEDLHKHLYTSSIPDPDLLIRTSGEMRVSNFLLWQIAYSEIYICDTLWPDFSDVDLLEAVIEYQSRERRFGGIKSLKD
jgi:undecaprenyl diphosphate synthase